MFLRGAKVKDTELLGMVDKVADGCQHCKRGGRPADRPKICLPMANEFNEVVTVDFAKVETQEYLKIVDIGSRLMRMVKVSDRSSKTVRKALLEAWITVFGPPTKAILGDRAKEFMGPEVMALCDTYGLDMRHSPAQAQFANGVNERHGGTLKRTVEIMRAEKGPGVDIDRLVQEAVMAHNIMANVNGFSPCQAAFALNPKLPTSLTEDLGGLTDGQDGEEMERMEMLRSAKKAFVEASMGRVLRRTLAARASRTTEGSLYPGDRVVFYPREGRYAGTWRGPARVQLHELDSKAVHLVYGGEVYNRHRKDVQLFDLTEIAEGVDSTEGEDDQRARRRTPRRNVTAGAEPMDTSEMIGGKGQEELTEERGEPSVMDDQEEEGTTQDPPDNGQLPFDLESGTMGPLTAAEKDWAGILISEEMWVNTVRRNEAPTEDLEQYEEQFHKAMEKEVDDLWKREVFEPVKEEEAPKDAQRIKMRWVLEWKEISKWPEDERKAVASVRHQDGEIKTAKARMVALGFQEKANTEATDSPTGSTTAMRLLITMAVQKRWRLRTRDVSGRQIANFTKMLVT